MKKQKDYTLVAVLFVFLMAAIPSFGPTLFKTNTSPKIANGIIKSTTDERGLTSVKYVQDGKTWALDYLDVEQLDSIKQLFKNDGCTAPPPHPCANGYCGATIHQSGGDIGCMCCAVAAGQHCKFHGGKQLPSGK